MTSQKTRAQWVQRQAKLLRWRGALEQVINSGVLTPRKRAFFIQLRRAAITEERAIREFFIDSHPDAAKPGDPRQTFQADRRKARQADPRQAGPR